VFLFTTLNNEANHQHVLERNDQSEV